MIRQPQPVGSLASITRTVPLQQKIQSIGGIAEGIRTMKLDIGMPIPEALKLVDLATKATKDYVATANKVAARMPEISDRVIASRRVVEEDFRRIINNRLLPGIRGVPPGQTNVNGPVITANISLMLFSIMHGYEALLFFEEIRPGALDLIPASAMQVMVTIAETVASLSSTLTAAFKNSLDLAKKASSGLLSLLKWGTVAGGLYLLYEVLKPKES
jgi:hypothetical protein